MEVVHAAGAAQGHEAGDALLDGALGLGDLRGVGVDLAQAQHVRQVVVHGVGQDEVAVGQPLHEGGGAQAVGAVVGEVGLSGDVEARDVGLQVVVHPQATHRIVHGGVDAHGDLVGVVPGDALVHLEQVAVSGGDGVLAQATDGLGEVQVDTAAHHPLVAVRVPAP